MKIKTNRIFNLLNKKSYSKLLIVCIAFVFVSVILKNLDNFFAYLISFIIASIFLFLTLIPFYIRTYPKELLVDEGRIEYTMRLYESVKQGISPIVTRPHRFRQYANVSNSEIKEIIYSSNKIEKLFNVGHIQINAKTYITGKDGKPLYIFDTAPATLIYGIKDFKNVKIKLQKALPNTKHIEN